MHPIYGLQGTVRAEDGILRDGAKSSDAAQFTIYGTATPGAAENTVNR